MFCTIYLFDFQEYRIAWNSVIQKTELLKRTANILKQLVCSVTKSWLAPCNPTDCNTSGFPFPHCLLDFAQTHVCWVSDAIQPSHLLSPPFLPVLSLSQFFRLFSNELALCIRWPQCWSFSFSRSTSNEYSGLISFRIDWFDLLAVQGKNYTRHMELKLESHGIRSWK